MNRLTGKILIICITAALGFAVLSAAGCGGGEGATTADTTAQTSTRTTPTATTKTSMDTTVEAPAAAPAISPAPEPAPAPATPAATPLKIIDYNVDPNTVHAGAPLTCTVTVQGEAVNVFMGLTGPSGSTPQTVYLVKGATSGGVTTWSEVATAPAMPGGWRFGATAVAGDGTEVIPDAGGLSASLLPFIVIP